MIIIRPEQPGDQAAIYEINRRAFEGRDAEPQLVDAIRSSQGYVPGLSLVAELDGELVGHILFSLVVLETDLGEQPILCLAPMSVLPEHQNRGIGSQLVRHGLEEARQIGFRVVNVLGHSNFYPRFGFRPARPMGILPPFDVEDKHWMAVELVSGGLSSLSGRVRYPPAFDGV